MSGFCFYKSFGTLPPFFLCCFTHSVSSHSICPLMDRKSSSAHCCKSFHNDAEIRRGTCFFAFSFSVKPSPPFLPIIPSVPEILRMSNHLNFTAVPYAIASLRIPYSSPPSCMRKANPFHRSSFSLCRMPPLPLQKDCL